MQSKPFWQSKTVIVNALTFLAMALALFVDFPATARYAPWLTLAIALVNLGLRAITTEPITLTRKDVVPPGVVDLTPDGEVPEPRPGEIVRGVPALSEVPEVTLEPGPSGAVKVENHNA